LSDHVQDGIFATNTSALPIEELARQTKAPNRVIGLHFFNPVSRMKLIEVVVGKNTSDETRDRALAFARQIGKLPVLVQDHPGFLVNRVLFPYLLEAAQLFEGGTDLAAIDQVLTKWGMPMGPLRLIDEIGVDITVDIARTLEKAYGRRDESPEILKRMQSEKLLGRKSGAGFYKYEGRDQKPNEALESWRKKSASPAEGDLAMRLMLLMVNEAAMCLEEKVVATPEDADYGMVLGTGFPTFRGGPLRFAQSVGLKRVVDEMTKLAQSDKKFTPCSLLQQHAAGGTNFYEAD
jgi:3-hydroxyacyl-CoA dehydrogenase/enoyl-CoA hydratase/3-hydroxybutyryl-CoA epimerase